jgi:hypothetical protein
MSSIGPVDCEERDGLWRKIDETQRKLYSLNHFMDTQNRSEAQKLQKRIERLHLALASHCAKHHCHGGLGAWGV